MKFVFYLALLNAVDLILLVICAATIALKPQITMREVEFYSFIGGFVICRIQNSVDAAIAADRQLAERGLQRG